LLLTDAFRSLGLNCLYGRINPETYQPVEYSADDEWKVLAELPQALAWGSLKQAVQNLLPGHPGYVRLRRQFIRYKALADAGGWVRVPGGPPLRKGDRGRRVALLKERLAASGDLAGGPEGFTDTFDDALAGALRRFQRRHGLSPDGVLGPGTLRAVNVPLQARIRQMELNLARWRWLWRHLGTRYIMVNVPDFSLTAVERGRPVLAMKAVVGKRDWNTPLFSARATHLVLNPSWHVPREIFAAEILPAVREDPAYLEEHRMVVLKGWGRWAREVDPAAIDWQEVDPRSFPYRIVQKPGPKNPLGWIKFVFPNKYEVYLHDTSSRGLFARDVLAFSHGCVRIEKPFELAEYLLGGRWSDRMFDGAPAGEEEDVTVPLPRPIDVHVVYLTAWVDDEGVLQFRNDIYGLDGLLGDALAGKPVVPPDKRPDRHRYKVRHGPSPRKAAAGRADAKTDDEAREDPGQKTPPPAEAPSEAAPDAAPDAASDVPPEATPKSPRHWIREVVGGSARAN
jgi:murein L,D-transpeptidase YcbB/YkuD